MPCEAAFRISFQEEKKEQADKDTRLSSFQIWLRDKKPDHQRLLLATTLRFS